MRDSVLTALDSLLRHSIALHDSVLTRVQVQPAPPPAPSLLSYRAQLTATIAGVVAGAALTICTQGVAAALGNWREKRRARRRLQYHIKLIALHCRSCATMITRFAERGAPAFEPLKAELALFETFREDVLRFRDQRVHFLVPQWIASIRRAVGATEAFFENVQGSGTQGAAVAAKLGEVVAAAAAGLGATERRGLRLFCIVSSADRIATAHQLRRIRRSLRRELHRHHL